MSKSHRMTNTIRDEIIKNMEREILGKRAKAINAQARELLVKLRDHCVGKEHLEAFKALPDKFFVTQGNCTVAIDGHSRYFESRPIQGFKDETTTVPWPNDTRLKRINLTTKTKLGRELEAHFEAIESFDADRRALNTKARAVLYSCATVKKLLETWPEAENWLPELPKNTVAGLPMVMISDLNGTIDRLREAA